MSERQKVASIEMRTMLGAARILSSARVRRAEHRVAHAGRKPLQIAACEPLSLRLHGGQETFSWLRGIRSKPIPFPPQHNAEAGKADLTPLSTGLRLHTYRFGVAFLVNYVVSHPMANGGGTS